jgi:kumamolisin
MASRAAAAKSQSSYVVLAGSKRDLLANSRQAGSIDPSEIASITVRVRSKAKKGDLDRAVQRIYAQRFDKRKYYSRAQLASEHGARAEDFDAIERYGQQNNLVVSHRNASERSLVFTGTLGHILNAFHANVHLYHHSTGSYRGRQGEILIPREFENIITGIFGFDTRPKHKAPRRQRAASMSGPGGSNGVAATDYAKRYNFPTKYKTTNLDGSGQCIGIVELGGGFNNSDLATFFKEIGVALPSVTAVSVDHGQTHPAKPQDADGEVLLDIEVAGAVAPGAKQAVYFAPNTGKGFLDAINHAVHDTEYNPSVISISWGEPDDDIEQQQLDAYHQVFQEAAALGVTVCAASGDHGSADMAAADWDKKIHVNHPASDDQVLACGGTQITGGKDVAWNDGTPFDASSQDGGGWATGGGVSPMFALPSYQAKAKVPKSLANGKSGRGVPDIAMSATNYFERVDGQEFANGGTSAVTPLMAGLVALLNQAKKKRVGFLNPFLYANASKGVVKDVTQGTNAIKNTVKGYNAGVGWDACTGLGTPDGVNILNNL